MSHPSFLPKVCFCHPAAVCRENSMQAALSFLLCLYLELHGELYEGRVAAAAEEECVSYNFLMENRSRGWFLNSSGLHFKCLKKQTKKQTQQLISLVCMRQRESLSPPGCKGSMTAGWCRLERDHSMGLGPKMSLFLVCVSHRLILMGDVFLKRQNCLAVILPWNLSIGK